MTARDVSPAGIFHVDPHGPLLAGERDALDLIAATYGEEIDLIAIPAARLSPDFFRLRTGIAGAFLQKLRNYGFRVAIVGDIARHVAAGTALRDFITESNRGGQVLFVPDDGALAAALVRR